MANASSPGFRLLARIAGRGAAVGLIAMVSCVLFAAAPAAACDLLDPTCVVDVVEDTVDDATETVDETVEDVTETVDETVETVEETVESVTGDTGETVEETVGSAIGPVDDVVGGPSPPTLPGTDPVPPGVVDAPTSGDDGTGGGSGGNGPGGGDGTAGAPPGGISGPFALDPSSLGSALVVETAPAPRGFLGGLIGPVAEVASRIAFPLALAGLVLLFVAFQNRLDRRDPKLALAATSPDVLRFG